MTRHQGLIEHVQPLLLQHKVDVYLSGHVHAYERTCVINGPGLCATSTDAGVASFDTSHVTRHTSHVTRHTSPVTPHTQLLLTQASCTLLRVWLATTTKSAGPTRDTCKMTHARACIKTRTDLPRARSLLSAFCAESYFFMQDRNVPLAGLQVQQQLVKRGSNFMTCDTPSDPSTSALLPPRPTPPRSRFSTSSTSKAPCTTPSSFQPSSSP